MNIRYNVEHSWKMYKYEFLICKNGQFNTFTFFVKLYSLSCMSYNDNTSLIKKNR